MARVSVIVPVYNVEDCLEWCLDSLRAQTMDDIEIVCVNDGATDDSRDVLARCAQRDGRIVIIDQANGGLSAARNTGMRAATSPYVAFLDADDRFLPQACERIVEVMDSTKADVLTFGAYPYPREAGTKWLDLVLSPRDVVYDAFDPALLFEEASRPFSWRTVCSREFLLRTGVSFDETLAFGEDQVFDFAIYPRAARTVLISDKLYEYRVSRSGSLMDRRRKDPCSMMLEHVEIVRRVFADWSNLMDDGGAPFLRRYAASMLAWVVEFVLYDSLSLDDRSWRLVCAALQPLLDGSYAADGLAGCSPSERAIIRASLSRSATGRARRGALAVRYYLEKRGLKRALEAVRERL